MTRDCDYLSTYYQCLSISVDFVCGRVLLHTVIKSGTRPCIVSSYGSHPKSYPSTRKYIKDCTLRERRRRRANPVILNHQIAREILWHAYNPISENLHRNNGLYLQVPLQYLLKICEEDCCLSIVSRYHSQLTTQSLYFDLFIATNLCIPCPTCQIHGNLSLYRFCRGFWCVRRYFEVSESECMYRMSWMRIRTVSSTGHNHSYLGA